MKLESVTYEERISEKSGKTYRAIFIKIPGMDRELIIFPEDYAKYKLNDLLEEVTKNQGK